MRHILILFLLTLHVVASAQEQRVSLESKQGRSYLSSTVWTIEQVNDVSRYKVLDTSDFSSWSIGVAPFNYAQYKLEYEGIDLNDTYLFNEFRQKQYEKDRAYLMQKEIPMNLLSIFRGDNEAGERIIILDENRNFDFTDDIIYRSKHDKPDIISTTLTFDAYNGRDLLSFPIFLQINPFSHFLINGKAPIVDVYSQDYLAGILEIEERKFLIQINDRDCFTRASVRQSAELKVLELPIDSGTRFFNSSYKLSDTIPVGSGLYVLDLSNKVLKFNKVGEIENERSIPVFREKDLLTDVVLENDTFKGRYTLIDFWGSWCGPCIQSLPHLVDIHQKYGDRLNMLSVASDQPKDVEKLKNLIDKHGLSWNHIWSDRSEDWNNSLPFRFAVSSFPTIVLLDPDTNEVKRFIGTNKLSSLDQQLKLIFEN